MFLSHLYISKFKCSRHFIENSLYLCFKKLLPQQRAIIGSMCAYQQVGIYTHDVGMCSPALSYLYIHVAVLNKPISVYNIIYNEWA